MSSTTAYDQNFRPDLAKLPDPQTFHPVLGSDVPIQKVGVNNLEVMILDHDMLKEASVSVYVPLQPNAKGINMSRLVRNLFTTQHDPIDVSNCNEINRALDVIKASCDVDRAHIKFRFKTHKHQTALRSGLVGYQFYNVVVEAVKDSDVFEVATTTDFIYSSACPCSYELAKQAIAERGVDAISHSQRSLCRTTVIHKGNVSYLDIIDMQRAGLVTETQTMVKREDEQAFAELNGSYPKFVEDAARLMHQQLYNDPRILDFSSVHEHWESLHSHNAVSVIHGNKNLSQLLKAQ